MSQITTHVLDTMHGTPANGVPVVLYQQTDIAWKEIGSGYTNPDGRVNNLLTPDLIVPPGIYKLKFEVDVYLQLLVDDYFFPAIEIMFRVKDNKHYHIPVLLNAFGYTTYRGS